MYLLIEIASVCGVNPTHKQICNITSIALLTDTSLLKGVRAINRTGIVQSGSSVVSLCDVSIYVASLFVDIFGDTVSLLCSLNYCTLVICGEMPRKYLLPSRI